MTRMIGTKPWKSVTLTESYTTNSTTILAEHFGVPTTGTVGYIYIAIFCNNSAQSYPVDMCAWVVRTDGTTRTQISWREDWGNVSTSTGRTLNASAGTRVDIYKLPIT